LKIRSVKGHHITRATVYAIGFVVVLAAGSSWWSANPVQAAPAGQTGGGSASTCSISYNLPGDIGANPNQATPRCLLVADVPCVKCAEGWQ